MVVILLGIAASALATLLIAWLGSWPNLHWSVLHDAARRFIPPSRRDGREQEWIAEVEAVRSTSSGKLLEACNLWLAARSVGHSDREALYARSASPGDLRVELAQPLNQLVKRVLDLLLIPAFVFVALPIVLLTALAVAMESRGPVVYPSERIGRHGRVFRVWRFRT